MAGWHPIKKREFVRKLIALGFSGPYRGTRHEYLVFRQFRQTVPSNAEFSVPQLRVLLRQVELILQRRVTPDEWNSL